MSRPARTTTDEEFSLIGLLGEQRAEIVRRLKAQGSQSVAELASHLGISEVATRRHVGLLEEEDLVASRTVKQDRGRPVARYELTDAARRLFPDRSAAVAGDLLTFLSDRHGRDGLREFLRWRLDRDSEAYREVVTAEDLHERLDQLADALSAHGYDATVDADGDGFLLRQDHCAIYDVAKQHPEVCAYEAATFSRVLGQEVRLSRRQTLAGGASACVCCVSTKDDASTGQD